MARDGTAGDMPSNLASLYLVGSDMLVRNKKVTATAMRREETEKPQTQKCKG